MYHIVKISPNKGRNDECVQVEMSVKSGSEAWEIAREFIDTAGYLTTFRGIWDDKSVLCLCDDNGMAKQLAPNKDATIAYLQHCIPGTMHVILGPVVVLLDKELW